MATLTVQHTTSGLAPTLQAAAASGDNYANSGAQTLLLSNSGPDAILVTITAQTPCNEGVLHDGTITVPGSTTFYEYGPVSQTYFNDINGLVNLAYSTTVQPAPGTPTAYPITGVGLGTGTYRYKLTFVSGSGETTGGGEISVTTTASKAAVQLVTIPTGPAGTTKRGIYRTSVGGGTGTEKLVAYINDNTTTSYTDTIPDSSLGASIPGSNTAGVHPPGAADTAAGAAGTPNGAYKYQLTFVNAGGETIGGVEFTITVTSTQVALTNIPLGPSGTTSRKLYRTAAAGASGTEKLVTTIADNTTTSYTDNTADGSLGVAIPTSNTATVLKLAATAA